MSELVTALSAISEDDSDRYPAHVKKLAEAAANRIAKLEDAVETAYGILWRDAGGYSSTAAFDARKVLLKVLGKHGQKRGIDAAISRYGPTTEREIIAALEPAAPEGQKPMAMVAELSGDTGELIDRMAAAIREDGGHYDDALRTFHEWQPIETAPHEVNVLLAYWDELLRGWRIETGIASWGWRRDGVSNMSRHGQATHWMPLPSPPKEDGNDG